MESSFIIGAAVMLYMGSSKESLAITLGSDSRKREG